MSTAYTNGDNFESRSFFKKRRKYPGYVPITEAHTENFLVRNARKIAKNGISFANFLILIGLAGSAIWYYATHEFNGLYASKSELATLASEQKLVTGYLSKDIFDIKTQQAVMSTEQAHIKKTVDKTEDKIDRITQKLFQSN